MFFDNLEQIPIIASKTNCTIFVVSPETRPRLKHALYIEPSDAKKTSVISVEQIRELIGMTGNRETSDRFFVITPADTMNEAAQNAFLKTFEEPKQHCHFVLLTEQPALLLPTIRSRAQIFFPKVEHTLDQPPSARAEFIALAKRFIATKPNDLLTLAEELSKVKTKPREHAQEVIATTIELLYKSYFKTGNVKFLSKISNFIKLYDSLASNGHLKLHLVADLL